MTGMTKIPTVLSAGSRRTCLMILAAFIAVGWCVLYASARIAAAESTIHDCDRLASLDIDMERVAQPVPISALRKPEAMEACKKAIDQEPDNPRLQMQYGIALVYSGDTSAGLRHLRRATAAGYAGAEMLAGILAEDKKFEGYDLPDPMTSYKRAADLGNPYAMYRLAQAEASGRGGDREVALNWARRAASNGLPNGDYNVAQIILSFRPHGKETEWAHAVVEKEIEAGNLEAMFLEALRTWSHGPFVSVPDFGYVNERAYRLILSAATQGHSGARAYLKMLRN